MSDPDARWIDRRFVLAGVATTLAPGLASAQQASGASREIVREAAHVIGREYHDERLGRRAERVILRNLRANRYRGLSEDALAERLTADAQTVLNDSHFGIMYGVMHANPGGGPSRPHEEPHRPGPQDLAFLESDNFGIKCVQVLAGNIGRIDVRAQFYRPIEEVRVRYAAAMTLLVDTSALIVDCSDTIGGDPKTVALFASYLFDREPFVLNRFLWRNLPVEEFRTTRTPGGPLYGEQKPVFVMVSAESFSAAEEFAYDMQATRRGVVVGQKTGGGANHGLPIIIANAFTAFVPQARAQNPITGANWEGVGVTPEIAADASDIAAVAHRTALQSVIATGSPERRERAEEALARS